MDIDEAKRRARSGPLILLIRRGAALLITFISTVTVARLVSPRDYGLANMSGVLLAFAGIFRDFGLTNAVLRKGVVSQPELSLIFWFNVATTTGLCLILALLAPIASSVYREPVILWTIFVSLIGFAVSGVTSQHRAILIRDLRFSVTAFIDTGASLVGLIVTLAVAWIRRDVWAIVYGNLAQQVFAAVVNVVSSGWKPGRPEKNEELGSLLRFGANSSVYSISVFLSQNTASLLIGYFLGPTILGQYNRAQALYNLPNANLIQPIAQATMPLLTKLRAHPMEYKDAYISMVRKLCLVLMPLSVTLAFAAVPLVEALLGPRWRLCGFVLMALSPSFCTVGISYAVGDLFVTQDRSAELRRLGFFELLLRVGGIGVGLCFGIVQTAIGYTVASIFVALRRVFVAGRTGPVSAKDQIAAALPGVPLTVGSLVACSILALFKGSLPTIPLAVAMTSAGVAGAFLAGLCTAASRSGMLELADTFGFLRFRQRFIRAG